MIWTAQIRCRQPWPSSFITTQKLLGTILSQAETEYIQKQRNIKRCFEFGLGRALTKLLLSEIVGVAVGDIRISLPNQRAPTVRIQDNMCWHLSITHSRGAIQVAVSNQAQLGVDIQRIDAHRNVKPFINMYPALTDIPENHFYLRWVCLEAMAKLQQVDLLDVLQRPFAPPPQARFETVNDSQYCSAIATFSPETISYIDGAALLPNSLRQLLSMETTL